MAGSNAQSSSMMASEAARRSAMQHQQQQQAGMSQAANAGMMSGAKSMVSVNFDNKFM